MTSTGPLDVDDRADLSRSRGAMDSVGLLGIMYVVVAGNFVSELLSCDARRILDSSMLAKHAVVLFGSLFWVAETTASNDLTFWQVIARALVIYGAFVMSTKSKLWALAPVVVCVFIDQLARVYEAKRRRDVDPHLPAWVRPTMQKIGRASCRERV